MPVSNVAYRDCLRHFPSGVTIVTIRSGQLIHGLTVSAFASVSLRPPQILVAIDHSDGAYSILEEDGALCKSNGC